MERRPALPEVIQTLERHAPALVYEPIEFLGEGWEFWAYRIGDYVARFPRSPVNLHRLPEATTNINSLRLELRLLPELAVRLSTPVPQIEVFAEDGPNGLPFAIHRYIPGEAISSSGRAPGSNLGRDLGRLISELQSFSVERAVELGVPYIDGTELRRQRGRHYERVIRGVFPLVSCEARQRIEQVFEAYLNQASNFDFEPRLVHQDLDMNCLVDTQTGELSGVIDFGGTVVSNPALDLWMPLYGLERLGIESQLDHCLREAGVTESIQTMRGEIDFIDFNLPLTDILSGLERDDEVQVADGIMHLNASLPASLKCD